MVFWLDLLEVQGCANEDTYGVIGMLDRIREPSAPPGVALPRDALPVGVAPWS